MYCLGWPFSLFLHHNLGLDLRLRVQIIHDDEAGVFVATSPDVDGLVIEADSIEAVMYEIAPLIPELIADNNASLDYVLPALKLS